MSSATCVSCHQPLVVEVDPDEDDVQTGGSSSSSAQPQTVPDDVHLNCGCHFHWFCLLEAYNIAECPNCSRQLLSTSSTGLQQILCTLHNEGGVQNDLDILPLLTEESYLKAYPEDRKARAFLEFCNQGDVQAIVDMLQDDEDEDEDEDEDDEEEQMEVDKSANPARDIDLLRYQDPIGDMQTGLHCAVANQKADVAWLLLYLASRLDIGEFPPNLLQIAESLGVSRNEEEVQSKPDIRSLRDSEGRSAEDVAREVGGVWQEWIGRGRLVV